MKISITSVLPFCLYLYDLQYLASDPKGYGLLFSHLNVHRIVIEL